MVEDKKALPFSSVLLFVLDDCLDYSSASHVLLLVLTSAVSGTIWLSESAGMELVSHGPCLPHEADKFHEEISKVG